MNYAWQGTLREASAFVASGEFPDRVERGFERAYAQAASPQEIRAWHGSLPGTIEALSGHLDQDTHLVLEYRLPFNGQRADLVVIGRNAGLPCAHVVELKQWQESSVHPRLAHFVLAHGNDAPHPSYQAANYAGKLSYFHSVVQNWQVSASAFVQDTSADRHVGLKDRKYVDMWSTAPVFLPGEESNFGRFVANEVPNPPNPEGISGFIAGGYYQSLRLLEALTKHQNEIQTRALTSLARTGWGLSDEQLHLHDEIIATVESGKRAFFLASGGPGCGKTLLAVHLLLSLAKASKRTVLAVRNNRLNAALKEVINFKPFGATGIVKYFSTQQQSGVEDGSDEIADVLVCDEAQRLALKSDNVFKRARVVVIFHDEEQILNQEEGGTSQRLRELAVGIGPPTYSSELSTLHRCRGGKSFMNWIDTLLRSPELASSMLRSWESDFSLKVVPSPQDLIEALKSKRKNGTRVALLAAFTRSSGYTKRKRPTDLLQIRIPEVNPPIQWLMDPNKDYVPFWVNGESNELTHCSSIYGCQGFETDFAGLIWGDDLVIRNGMWEIGNPENCYDSAPGATKLSSLMKQDRPVAMRLLKNRYRILLTRGIFGTTVYCEDAETGEFLRTVLTTTQG